jgi:hypothetical protein
MRKRSGQATLKLTSSLDLVKQGKIDLQAPARRTPQGRIAAPEEIAPLPVSKGHRAAILGNEKRNRIIFWVIYRIDAKPQFFD